MFTADAKQSPVIEKEPESSEEESDGGEEKAKETSPVVDKQQPESDTSTFTLTSEESEVIYVCFQLSLERSLRGRTPNNMSSLRRKRCLKMRNRC